MCAGGRSTDRTTSRTGCACARCTTSCSTKASSVSARAMARHVAEALRFKRDRDRLRELSDWLQEEHGPLTDEERTTAFDELEGLDAEHERRRATGTHGAAEAA